MTQITWPEYTSLEWKAKPRNEARVLIKVDVEPQSTLVCGSLLSKGENFALVYKSDLPKVRERVQTDADRQRLETAKTLYAAALAKYAADKGVSVTEAEETFPRSIPEFFGELGGTRGIPPLKSLVVGPEVPPPETPEGVTMQSANTQAQLAMVLAKLLEKLEASEKAKK